MEPAVVCGGTFMCHSFSHAKFLVREVDEQISVILVTLWSKIGKNLKHFQIKEEHPGVYES